MAQVKCVFFLPDVDTDGRDLLPVVEQCREEVYDTFGAWSFLGYVEGTYRMMSGAKSADMCLRYFVILDESRIPELEAILRRYKAGTKQETIYLEIQRNVDVRFL